MARAEHLKINAILENDVWFGNRVVTWTNAPNNNEAERDARMKVNRLRRKPRKRLKPDYAQLRIADALASCSKGHRCLNGACPTCGLALQRWLTPQVVQLAAAEDPGWVFAINIVPALQLSETLSGAELAELINGVHEKLVSTDLVQWAVLGLDVSFNDFTQVADAWPDGMAKSGWQPHVYGFICAKDKRAFKAALPELFPQTLSVPVPCKTKEYDGSAYGASYCLKWQFQRRVSYRDARTGALNTSDYKLSAENDIKLMRALSELGLTGRITLINVSTIFDPNKQKFNFVINPTVKGA